MKNNFTIKVVLPGLFYLFMTTVTAQNLKVVSPQLLELSIDEDYLNYRGSGTDRYYTAGIELTYYFKKRKITQQHLEPVGELSKLHFISLKQTMNTPSIISTNRVQKGDYPYAGVLYGTYGTIHFSEVSRTRFTKALSVGTLGPKAFAGETQAFVHGLINYTKPEGWDTQIKRELMLNFKARFDKGLVSFTNKFDVITTTELNVGTVYDNASVGFMVRFGKLNSYFSNFNLITLGDENTHKQSLYIFVNPSITVVGYNGSLQGGLSEGRLEYTKDDYIVSSDDINRLLSKVIFGVNFESGKFSASISQVIQSAEFATVQHHEYGNISIAFLL